MPVRNESTSRQAGRGDVEYGGRVDWAPVVTTGIGAAAALLGGWISTARQSKAQRRSAIRQDRADAYVEVADVCFELVAWCQRSFPMMEFARHENPPPPTDERQRHLFVLMEIYASGAVRDAWADTALTVRDISARVGEMGDLRHRQAVTGRQTEADASREHVLYGELFQLRQQLETKANRLTAAMRADLTADRAKG